MSGQSRDKETIKKLIRGWIKYMDRQIELWVQHFIDQIISFEN